MNVPIMQSIDPKIQAIPRLIENIYSNGALLRVIRDIVDEAPTPEDLPEFIFTGVGKNWYVCEKTTKTFLSMGLKARALDCTHALHGDLGMLEGDKKKVMFFISKSGTTEELVKLAKVVNWLRDIKYIKNLRTVGMFMNRNNKGKVYYDYEVTPTQSVDDVALLEFDDRNLVPSISINVTQTILDMSGVLIFQSYPELVENYKYNHLGGNNGRLLGVDGILESMTRSI